ncbi:UNVERIFIED_CONTAM: hypothetical protein FKN15_035777 [Acipenser sinensis]
MTGPPARHPRCADCPQLLPITASEKGEAFQAGKGHYGPQGPDGPGEFNQGGWEEASPLALEDTLSIAASGEGVSFCLSPALFSSVSALMGHTVAFLQVPWTPAVEPRRSVFRTQEMAPRPQKFPAFPDFMEEVRSSWDRPASGSSVLKHTAPLASLEGADKLGLAEFPPVDSTIAALVKAPPLGGLARDLACPNPQCKVTETHLKRLYAAEAQATRLSNTVSVLTAYMDGVLREAQLLAVDLQSPRASSWPEPG